MPSGSNAHRLRAEWGLFGAPEFLRILDPERSILLMYIRSSYLAVKHVAFELPLSAHSTRLLLWKGSTPGLRTQNRFQ